jgi:hypothetical protein
MGRISGVSPGYGEDFRWVSGLVVIEQGGAIMYSSIGKQIMRLSSTKLLEQCLTSLVS